MKENHQYIVLLRGINVGGKNRVPMAELRDLLSKHGFEDVRTYIQSGNVLLSSVLEPTSIKQQIETLLIENFKLDSALIKALVLTDTQFRSVIANKPAGFGDQPEKYHSDVIFLMNIPVEEALKVFKPREGVDSIWPGIGVIYSQRLSTERTKSRLNKIVGTPAYQSMTIRNWNTTLALQTLATKVV